MPSDLSYWLVSAPLKDGDPDVILEDIRKELGGGIEVGGFEIPELKVSAPLSQLERRDMRPARHPCLGAEVDTSFSRLLGH